MSDDSPTKKYVLDGDHLGGILNLMSDLYGWITNGYEITIDVYLRRDKHE